MSVPSPAERRLTLLLVVALAFASAVALALGRGGPEQPLRAGASPSTSASAPAATGGPDSSASTDAPAGAPGDPTHSLPPGAHSTVSTGGGTAPAPSGTGSGTASGTASGPATVGSAPPASSSGLGASGTPPDDGTSTSSPDRASSPSDPTPPTASSRPEPDVALVAGFPKSLVPPPGTHVEASGVAADEQHERFSMVARTDQPPAQILGHYRARLVKEGFTEVPAPGGGNGVAFRRGNDSVLVTVSDGRVSLDATLATPGSAEPTRTPAPDVEGGGSPAGSGGASGGPRGDGAEGDGRPGHAGDGSSGAPGSAGSSSADGSAGTHAGPAEVAPDGGSDPTTAPLVP